MVIQAADEPTTADRKLDASRKVHANLFFQLVTKEEVQNHWYLLEEWIDLIYEVIPISNKYELTPSKLKGGLSGDIRTCRDGDPPSEDKVVHVHENNFHDKNGVKQRLYYAYISSDANCKPSPPQFSAGDKVFIKSSRAPAAIISPPPKKRPKPNPRSDSSSDDNDTVRQIGISLDAEKDAGDEDEDENYEDEEVCQDLFLLEDGLEEEEPQSVVETLRNQDYFDSPEAKKLFGLEELSDVPSEDIRVTINHRIELLQKAITTREGYRLLLEDCDCDNLCTQEDAKKLTNMAKILIMALRITLKHDSTKQFNFTECCRAAIEMKKECIGFCFVRRPKTVRQYHHTLRTNHERFPNPGVVRQRERPVLPPLLDANPDLHKGLNTFCRENLEILSGELVLEYVTETGLPTLLTQIRKEKEDPTYTMERMLADHGLKTVCQRTIYNWLARMDYKFGTKTKVYFVDSHNKPDTVKARTIFVPKYFQLELRAHRWVQMPLKKAIEKGYCLDPNESHKEEEEPVDCLSEPSSDEEEETQEERCKQSLFKRLQSAMKYAKRSKKKTSRKKASWKKLAKKIKSKDKPKKHGTARTEGHRFTKQTENGEKEEWIEYHVDDHEDFLNLRFESGFGGNLSVRFPKGKKPVIIFGQDECIFRQYLFNLKGWSGPKGLSVLRPKDEGMGLMISAMCSREKGFGWELTAEELVKVNLYRRGKCYSDTDAAVKLRGTSEKEKHELTKSPFVEELEYGANAQGYWQYEHTILQLEDCIDVCKALLGDTYEYIFLYDHSSGHSRQKDDGLNANRVNKSYGGTQPKMRDTKVLETGPFFKPGMLPENMVQSMVFKEGDEGPWYLSSEERMAKKEDFDTGKKIVKKLKKDELIERLKAKNVSEQQIQNCKNVTEVGALCKDNGVPLTETVQKIEKGWMGGCTKGFSSNPV